MLNAATIADICGLYHSVFILERRISPHRIDVELYSEGGYVTDLSISLLHSSPTRPFVRSLARAKHTHRHRNYSNSELEVFF